MVSTRVFEAFVGAWALINNTRTDNGNVIADSTYGENPVGVIMYTSSGYMSAVLSATTPALRPQDLTLPSQPNQTDHEWALVGKHTLAYSGPFHFNGSLPNNETAGQVVHGPLITSTLPDFVGSLQHRDYHFSDNTQTLRLVGDLGNGVVDTLYWQRLERDFTFNSWY